MSQVYYLNSVAVYAKGQFNCAKECVLIVLVVKSQTKDFVRDDKRATGWAEQEGVVERVWRIVVSLFK